MTNVQLANWLNNYVTKNELVDPDTWTQLAEDLSNYEDVGKSLSELSVTDLENLKENFIAQIRNEFIFRKLEEKTYGLIKSKNEYDTTIQRIMAQGVFDAMDSHINNLSSGVDYTDGYYVGQGFSTKIFEKSDAFKVKFSISDDEWKGALRDVNELSRIKAIITGQANNSYTHKINALAKRIFVSIIKRAKDDAKVIHLITEFNRECNKDFDETSAETIASTIIPYAEITSDRDLKAMFDAWLYSIIDETVSYVGEFNKVYQEGENFTPRDRVKVIMLDKIASRIKYLSSPITYREVNAPTPIETISGWQTTGKNIVKSLGDVSTIKIDEGEDPTSETTPKAHIIDTIENVVGVIYDTDGCGITLNCEKTTSSYIGSEGFTNYYMHSVARYYNDDRFSAIVLQLD